VVDTLSAFITMDIQIETDPSFSLAIVGLESGEPLLAEGDAMVSMSGNVDIDTRRLDVKSGGDSILGQVTSAAKQMLAGESFLVNHLTSTGTPAEVTLSPTLPGDISQYRLDSSADLIIQSSSYLASETGITLDGEWGGARSFFGGEGLFMLRAAGKGEILFNSFGGIQAENVDGSFIVDTGHIVAFEDTLDFQVSTFEQGWIASWLSGEGLICRFEGNGTVYTQSRAPNRFGRILGNMLPPRES